jgi:ABC-type nitrate/sulfonate/bicarbonate transport system ATPase subunit
MIEIKNLNKSFGKLEVIKNLNLTINKGEVVSIVGPSGCGKSTLLRCITGLDKLFQGEINLVGLPNNEYLKSDRIAVVLQKYSNFPWLNVRENIETAFINETKKNKQEQNEIIETLLVDIHLDKFSESHINELSGGMQQRVAVARAIAQDTDILAFDEPFGALDNTNRNKLQLLFKELNTKFDKTVMFITHDIEEAIFVSDKIIVLSKSPSYVFKTFESIHKKDNNINIKYDTEFVNLKKEIELTLQTLSK